ncbi:hypothetical protein ALC62_02957 [Cyphomyrmex costatus]|uniref:Uncharacterized protein n=1 Tax=Cyphomyrmex costatus TaxID=456900 RepID=A0A151IMH3_9HYME|nr:hypothetical protein ALC62_02957 [Cyphomyrmex costatus]
MTPGSPPCTVVSGRRTPEEGRRTLLLRRVLVASPHPRVTVSQYTQSVVLEASFCGFSASSCRQRRRDATDAIPWSLRPESRVVLASRRRVFGRRTENARGGARRVDVSLCLFLTLSLPPSLPLSLSLSLSLSTMTTSAVAAAGATATTTTPATSVRNTPDRPVILLRRLALLSFAPEGDESRGHRVCNLRGRNNVTHCTLSPTLFLGLFHCNANTTTRPSDAM